VIDNAAFSRLGFGVTGPHCGLGASRSLTRDMIREAVRLGVTTFDTGPAYGNGEAEHRLGDALKTLPRERAFVITKAGIGPHRRRDFSPGGVEMSLKASLARLKLDRIDLLLLHGPSPDEMSKRLIRRLRAFVERGMLGAIGVCGRGPELDHAIGTGAFDAIMAPVHAQLAENERDRLIRARQSGHTIIGIEAMAGAAAPLRLPRSRGDIWYLARSLKQRATGTAPAPSSASKTDGLKWAIQSGLADSVICLTTRTPHLAANARLAGLEASAPAH